MPKFVMASAGQYLVMDHQGGLIHVYLKTLIAFQLGGELDRVY